MRYRIDLSYDGAPFCGWQIQPGAPSVQETLQRALSTLLHEDVAVTGCGRTDTGVNASHYVAHFDCGEGIGDCARLCYRLNSILPEAVAVRAVAPAADDFHARFDARRREYRYYLHRKKDPFCAAHSYFWGYPDVDFDAMQEAASRLLGVHDFSCFEKTGGDNKTSICNITEAGWTRIDDDHWVFTVAADRFLRNMVRAIVGTLLEVGRGKRSAASISELLDNGDRCRAGESVPGHALFLSEVDY